MSTARLHGADHAELGEVATIGEARAAIGISRGGAIKRYSYRDPNEDSVGFRLSEWGAVAAIADGHAGGLASQVAVDHLLDHHAPRWLQAAPIALDTRFPGEAGEVGFDLNTAIVRASTGGDADGSRTTLSAVLVRPNEGWLAVLSVGDSHVFRVDVGGTTEVAAQKGDRPMFLGDPGVAADRLAALMRAEVMPTAGARALVLVTDGISEHGIGVADPAAAVGAAIQEAAPEGAPVRALSAARGVVDQALASHRQHRSGDNVASAVLWLA